MHPPPDRPGGNKINAIKVVREITGLGLKEAKDIVEAAPRPIISGITFDEAEGYHAKLTEVGAVASVEAAKGDGTESSAAERTHHLEEALSEWKAIAAEWRSLYHAR